MQQSIKKTVFLYFLKNYVHLRVAQLLSKVPDKQDQCRSNQVIQFQIKPQENEQFYEEN